MYSISEVASANGIASHRIRYLLEKGVLKEPPRVNGRRVFSASDIELVRLLVERRRLKNGNR